ncbi:ATP synthase F1 subunit delta [Candidatus Gottesmanbacteria bacterium]|nr:ATP synthase F1 subunit delta [Candidatus Gottesmanbacteria bacterium]
MALSKDAKGFVDGVVGYLSGDARSRDSVPKVSELFRKVTAKAQKEKTAKVETAVALNAGQLERLSKALETLTGHSVDILVKVDSSLVAGFRITVGDWVVDTSLSGQLEAMETLLL